MLNPQRLLKAFTYVRYFLLFLIIILGVVRLSGNVSNGIVSAIVIATLVFFANSVFELMSNYLVIKEEMAEENRKGLQ